MKLRIPFPDSVRLLLLVLLLAVSPVALAQSPVGQEAAPNRGGDIGDGNVALNYAFGAASTIGSFEVPLGTNHLVDGWWWYRIDGDAAESRLPAPDTETYAGSSATFTWTNVDGRGFDLSLTTSVRDTAAGSGAAGTAISRLTVSNPGGSPLDISWFFYTNVNLAATSASDTASLLNANDHILIEEGLTTAELLGVGAVGYEVDLAPAIRDALEDGGVTNLSNSGLPFGPNDFSSAFQWTLTVPGSDSRSLGACIAVNHSCSEGSISIALATAPASPLDVPFAVDGPNPDPTFTHKWGGKGNGQNELNNPTGMVVDASGRLYVSDSDNDRIQIFSPTGRYLDTWGSSGSAPGEFLFPNGITVDDVNGWVYVADAENDRIQKFDLDGNVLLAWGTEGSGNGQFQFPADVALASNGFVYVADSSNHRIQVFDSSGGFLFAFGDVGSGNGEFISPRGIAISGNGQIFVADTFNNRVQRFDSSGQFQLAWGSSGTNNGQFDAPLEVAIDSLGRVYVTDLGNERVQVFDQNGTFLFTWGSLGLGDGQFVTLSGVALDAANNIYVSDTSALAANVQRFASTGFPLDAADPDDNDGVPAARTLYDIPAGAWDIIVDLPADWFLTDLTCLSNDPNDSSSANAGTGVASLDLDLGEQIHCTYSAAPSFDVQLPVVINGAP